MRRREFIFVLGASAMAMQIARAQQGGKTRLIGLAAGFSEEEMRPLLQALQAQLQVYGWTVGNNLALEACYASGAYDVDQVRALISRKPDVIVTQGTGMLTVVRKETTTIPIVFTMVPDPVKLGIVGNLARPGGNLTGFTNFEFSIGGKWLQLLKELKPSLKRVVQISNVKNPNNVQFSRYIEQEGGAFGLEISTAEVRNADELAPAVASAGQHPDTAIVVLPDSLLIINRARISEMATKHRMPALYPFRIFTEDGGLMSYGLNFSELYRQAAGCVDRVLKGEKARRLADPGSDKVRADHQRQDSKVARDRRLAAPARACRRGDRMIVRCGQQRCLPVVAKWPE